MLKPSFAIAALFLSNIFLSSLASAAPIISVEDLKNKLGSDNLVVLEIQPLAYYQQAHIPGSVHTDYVHWRLTDKNGLGKMLPEITKLESLIGALGISNQSEVVIVPVGRGAGDMAAAARVYWTLYVAGLEQLSILEGGIIAYFKTHGEQALELGIGTKAVPKTFTAKLRQQQIMDADQVSAYLKAGYSIIDARSPEEFSGQIAGSPTERPGALPTSINLPYDGLMNATDDALLSRAELQAKFEQAGIPLSGEQVSYCHTGHRTSLVWFVTHELLGNKDARLYDGSTLEWASTTDLPLTVQAQ